MMPIAYRRLRHLGDQRLGVAQQQTHRLTETSAVASFMRAIPMQREQHLRASLYVPKQARPAALETLLACAGDSCSR
jgi:hypothetical protein